MNIYFFDLSTVITLFVLAKSFGTEIELEMTTVKVEKLKIAVGRQSFLQNS